MASRLLALDAAPSFEAALGQKPLARTPHFSLHVMVERKLSTAPGASPPLPVDEFLGDTAATPGAADSIRLGMVVPKRHARRSVTRNLVRRQLREGLRRHLPDLPAGVWVLRLRAPFDRSSFRSAASEALRSSVRAEVERLLHDAQRRLASAPQAVQRRA